MKIFRGIENLSPGNFGSPVLAIGTFDGVHLGHMAIISGVLEWAASERRGSLLFTFSTHPRAVVRGAAPAAIIPLHERLAIISRTGIESAILLDFDEALSETDPVEFCSRMLKDLIGASGVVLGHGARFGRARAGDADLLRRAGPGLGIGVRELPPAEVNGKTVSSSAIRRAVSDGDLELAAAMLGRPVALIGRVVKGRGMGAGLGYPTANLSLDHDVRPPEGVWRGRTRLDDSTWPCVVSIGRTPTFGPGMPEIIEVHVIGFDHDLLGFDMRVEVIGKIRGQLRFENARALSEAIAQDIQTAVALHDAAPENCQEVADAVAGTGRPAKPAPHPGRIQVT